MFRIPGAAGLLWLGLALLSRTVAAAPISLSEIPLFLGTRSAPNIMLLIDDSGSMDWNLVTRETSGVMQFRCTATSNNGYHNLLHYGYTHQTGDESFADSSANGIRMPTDELVNSFSADDVPGGGVAHDQGFWRAWNSDFNTLYYDPEVRYQPWKGRDNTGSVFAAANPAAVRTDPAAAGGATYNLTSDQTYRSFIPCRVDAFRDVSFYPARYYLWSDSDSDGTADPEDQRELIELRPEESNACSVSPAARCPVHFERGNARNDCAAIAAGSGNRCTRTEELRNFANWFQYYRRRELTAKAAFGSVAAESSDVRMGLATLHDNNAVKTAIRSLDIGSNRSDLLKNIYRGNASGGTPFLTAVNDCGLYLNCGGSSTSTEAGSALNSNRNPYGFRHDGNRDDIDGDGGSDSLAPGCPALLAAKGGACQQNFLIAMTDGYYNSSNPQVGNHDADGSSPDTAGNTSWDGGAYADTLPHTLADISMRFYERDIQPNLANNVPAIPGVDSANHQHMVSYMVAFGLDGTIGPHTAGTNADGMPANPATAFPWPNPGTDNDGVFPDLNDANPEKLDDLRHAAYNGRGRFLSARRPQELIDALLEAISDITERNSSASSVALNSGSLNTGTRIFQARFDSSDWSGELRAFSVSSGDPGQGNGCSAETLGQLCSEQWNAADQLGAQHWDTARHVITHSAGTGTAFRWDALDRSQQDYLCDDPDTSADETCNSADLISRGQARLEYLRGSRANEEPAGMRFRARRTPLGDIVNSDPFFVGPPAAPYDSQPAMGAGYAAFRATHRNRTPLVLAGANDGMLHVFNAQTGAELLAYVPSNNAIYTDLNRLSSRNYAVAHRFFVDGSPTAGDAYFDADSNGSDEWRTVAVGSLRAGGQGIFALDLTDPSHFSEDNAAELVLWEFSDLDDPDLGFTYSRPSIVQMQNGKWAVLIGNGYNNSQMAAGLDSTASSEGHGYLFVLFLDGPGSDKVWNEGTDYLKLEVAAGSVGTPNGLASPAGVDLNGDFKVDYVYAGDLEGNLWRFDVNAVSPALWAVGRNGNPIFRACSASPCTGVNRQPITSRPEVGSHPDGPPTPPASKGVLIYFGTGRYIARTDKNPGDGQNQQGTANQTQTFYGVWDPLDETTAAYTRADLTQQRITQEINADGTGCSVERPDCFRVISNNPVTLSTADGGTQGWYLDLFNSNTTQNPSLRNDGERQVSDPVLRAGRLIFTTLIPNPNQCEFGGSGWLMELNPFSGAQLGFMPFDVNNDGQVDAADSQIRDEQGNVTADLPVLAGMRSTVGIIPRPTLLDLTNSSGPDKKLDKKFLSGSLGSIQTVTNRKVDRSGRLTWRQIR